MSPTTALGAAPGNIMIDDAAWQGPWRRVRVGEKVALSGGLLLTALLAPPWPGCVLVTLACIVFTCGPARIPPRTLALAMAAPLPFLVVGGVTVAVVLGGTPSAAAHFTWGPFWADPATVGKGAAAFSRGVAGTLAIMLLATTTPMVDLLTWLRSLGVPAPLIEIASLTYRLLFVLLSSALAIRAAQVARLGRAGIATAASAMGSLLIRSWTRAALLQAGLEGRGYVDELPTLPIARAASPGFRVAAALTLISMWVTILMTEFL